MASFSLNPLGWQKWPPAATGCSLSPPFTERDCLYPNTSKKTLEWVPSAQVGSPSPSLRSSWSLIDKVWASASFLTEKGGVPSRRRRQCCSQSLERGPQKRLLGRCQPPGLSHAPRGSPPSFPGAPTLVCISRLQCTNRILSAYFTSDYIFFLSIIVYYKILNIIPYAVQLDFIAYFIYYSLYLLIPRS